MDLAGHDLLARAILAEDEDVRIGRRGALDELADALASGASASSLARPRSMRASIRLRRSTAALLTVASSRSLLHGLATKSLAPALIASTARDTPPCAVMITTAASGSISMILPR